MKKSPMFVMLILFTSLLMFSGITDAQITDGLKYPKLTPTLENYRDAYGEFPTAWITTIIQNVPHELVTADLTGGSTGTTVNDYVFVAPTKLQVIECKFIKTVVNVGTSNTPSVLLITGTDTVAIYESVALSGAIGDVHTLVLKAAKTTIPAGTKIIHRIVTPTATVTTALKGKLQVVWKSVP